MSTSGGNAELTYASVASAENPWPGLLSFREADQRWFQGRREETSELVQHVRRERLTVLFALSGIGKSSLLQAGLFPALRHDDIFPVPIRLDYATHNLDLRAQVFEAIAHAAESAGISVPKARGNETLWEYFHNVNADFWTADKQRVLPLLVFDQFEEIFTLGRNEQIAPVSEAFLEDLADLAEGTVPLSVARRWASNPADKDEYVETGEYKVLISLREDFLAELSDQRHRIAGVPQKQYRLHQMSGEGAKLAVSQASNLVDDLVADRIVRYVASGERADGRIGGRRRGLSLKDIDVEPALLSVVCRELNNRRREKNERMISADLLEGSQEDVLNDFYERSFDGLPQQVRAFVEEQLITVGGARNSVPEENALHSGMTAADIERLVERRLLRREYRRNEVRLELTHDLLTGVVRSSRDRRRTQEAEVKRQREAAETRAKIRRNTRLVAAFAVIAIAAVTAAGLALQQTNKVKVALAAETTAKAAEQKSRLAAAENAKLAVAKATEATQNAKTAEEKSIEATQQTELANTRLTERDASAREAIRKAKEAADSEAKALAETKRATESEAKSLADTKRATESEAKANESAANEAAQRKLKEEEARKNAKEGANGSVTNAVGAISSGQPELALGHLAHALTLDPDSLSARTLALDQLLRSKSAHLATSGTERYVHPILTHTDTVLFAAFSPDGRQIVTASKDQVIRLWDWESGRSIAEFKGHTAPVNMVTFSPDGSWLVSASQDQTARVWNVGTHVQLRELHHSSQVLSAVFSHDGRRIVTASQDKTAQIWDAQTGAKIGNPLQHQKTVNFASFSPDGQKVVTACADSIARIWSLNGVSPVELPHSAEVKSAVFNATGTRIVTASMDSKARVWNASSGVPIGGTMQHGGPVFFAVFSPDGNRIATASKSNEARVWDAATGNPITAPFQHEGPVVGVSFSPDSRRIVTASLDKTARVFEVFYPFDKPEDLVRLLEAIGGFSGADENVPPLQPAQRQQLLGEVQRSANQTGATATFINWFLSHRQGGI